jgi:hypothetical protein
MKKLLLLFIFLLFAAFKLLAQGGGRYRQSARNAPLPPPIPLREVSGIVKDTTDNTIIGAIVTLMSKKDTMRTATNSDGIFVFKNVKLATFILTVAEIGYKTTTRKYLNNDAVKQVVLDPIILKGESKMLKQININGTPSITYKTDTVEYRASDYKVRENATVDELLSKMEGMEVGSDGTLTHQGQQVTKARLNGKDFAGGNVAQAIQTLPADIVDKIQIVDDYGDEAARTGVKDGTPQKVLNITTRADRSVGDIGRITAGEGNDDRFDDRLFLQRIDANEQLGFIGNFRNTVNGVASTGLNAGSGGTIGSSTSSNGGSGGTTKTFAPSFNYRDDWSKKIEVNMSYTYNYNNVSSITNSNGQQYSDENGANGTTNFINNSTGSNKTGTHTFHFDMEYSIDSANYMRIQPNFSYSDNTTDNQSQIYDTGFINQTSFNNTTSSVPNPSYGAVVFYQHLFKKKRRNISLQLSYTYSKTTTTNTEDNTILYYQDTVTTNTPFLDSLIHRVIQRGSLTRNYRASLTYVEPLTAISQFEFNAQYIYHGYNNNAFTDNIDSLNRTVPIDSLTNIYSYSFVQSRFAFNYRLNQKKYNLSLGATAIPTLLQGEREGYGDVDHSDFHLIPIFRFQYSWSNTERLAVNYAGTPTEPTYNELQPVTDYTNPQNPVIGNANLKPAFTHSITTTFNDYVANSQFNFSTNITTSITDDQVVTNNVLVPEYLTKSGKKDTTYVPYTHYVNLNGGYNVNANYNVAKQLDNREYNLELNGNVSYGHNVAMRNNIENYSNTWSYNERLGPRIDPNDWLEVNPYVSYAVTKSSNTLPGAIYVDTRTLALNLTGRFYFLRTWMFGYSGSKNYVTGISQNLTKNPLVINATVEKELFKKHNGILSIQAFDLLDQNNFVNKVITPTGYTDTKTNALSRYVMISFRLNLQKWSGAPKRNGKAMQRRGDGSFIY